MRKEFHAKHSKVFDWEREEDREEYKHWMKIYPFLYDITMRVLDERRKQEGG